MTDIAKFDVPVLPTNDELNVGISNSAEELALEVQHILSNKASKKDSKIYLCDKYIPGDQKKKVKRIMGSWAEAQGYKYSYCNTSHFHEIVTFDYAKSRRWKMFLWAIGVVVAMVGPALLALWAS